MSVVALMNKTVRAVFEVLQSFDGSSIIIPTKAKLYYLIKSETFEWRFKALYQIFNLLKERKKCKKNQLKNKTSEQFIQAFIIDSCISYLAAIYLTCIFKCIWFQPGLWSFNKKL